MTPSLPSAAQKPLRTPPSRAPSDNGTRGDNNYQPRATGTPTRPFWLHEGIKTNFLETNAISSLPRLPALTNNPTLLCRVVAPPSSMRTETKGLDDAHAKIRGQAGIDGFDLSVLDSQVVRFESAMPEKAETF